MSFSRVSNLVSGIRQWYSEINGATLTGAIDVIVVEQDDGTFISSPFHVRFGKLGVLKAKEKIVDIEVNGAPVDIHMKLDDNGAAFFVEGLDESEQDELPPELATSPLPSNEPLEGPPKWNEAQLEAVNRSLLPEFENKDVSNETGRSTAEDTTDDASGLLNNKNSNKISSKSKRKKKSRSKHSRTGSKASLKEILIDNANQNFPVPSPPTPTAVNLSSELATETHETSANLLLARLPNNQNDLENFLKNEEKDGSLDEIENRNSTSSLPIPLGFERKYQYFSEPEISPGTSPMGSRPGSPILSDTEFETGKGQKRGSISASGGAGKEAAAEQSWEWGKLPSSITPSHHKETSKSEKKIKALENNTTNEEDENKRRSGWGISNYLFGGHSKKRDPNAEEAPGVYLDDLKGDDEEMLKIYLGETRTRSNTISRDLDNEDAESGNGPSLPMSPHSVEGAIGYQGHLHHEDPMPTVDISLCGGIEDCSPILFEQSKISFDDFLINIEENPEVLKNPSLVVRIGESYHKWETAAPIIMSHVLYGRSLPNDLTEKLKGNYGKNKTISPPGSAEKQDKTSSGSSSAERKSSWWPFSSRKEKEDAGTLTSTPSATSKSSSLEPELPEVADESNPNSSRKRRNDTTSSSSEAESVEAVEKYKKTLRLPNEAIQCLNLKKGANELQFSVTTAYQGTTRCYCHVYLWNHSDKIVISDIDGTITKSDVLGHVFPMIGRDWAQSGVASLFTKIVNNGYHIVYLSARAIGQASITKEYLASVKQGDLNLPDGPIFLNPTSLVNAFHREVIEKKPEEFKIACLRDIKKLFPQNPFYAGYGNRVNDVWAYQAVGIPMSRIFTINPKGELRHELTNAFQTSYGSMSTIVDHVFPPTDAHSSPSVAMNYSSFTFWREPLPTISDNVTELHLGGITQPQDAGTAAGPGTDQNKDESGGQKDTKELSEISEQSESSSSTSSQTTIVETLQLEENLQ